MKKSMKMLLLTVAASLLMINGVLATYLLVRVEGPPLTVTETVAAEIQYGIENNVFAEWTLTRIPASHSWYCRLKTTQEGYSGNVVIDWFLEEYDETSLTWNVVPDITVSTSFLLSGDVNQFVYASPNGDFEGNTDWASYTEDAAEYRVVAEITEAEGAV